jgi:hypothetical protein
MDEDTLTCFLADTWPLARREDVAVLGALVDGRRWWVAAA